MNRAILLVSMLACGTPTPPAPTSQKAPAPVAAPEASGQVDASAPPPDAAEPPPIPDAPPPAPAEPPQVPCKADDDCWLDGMRPIARPASERGKRPKPCKDSSRIPACKENVCTVIAYKC